MTNWMIWFGIAGALVILEMFTGTFYLLMVAIGFAAAGAVALADAGSSTQFAVAAIVGVIATVALQRSKPGRGEKADATRDPNINLDIGQTIVVDAWNEENGASRTARATYRGALWDVELEPGAEARPGAYVIREVRGSRLVVGSGMSGN